MCRFSCAWANPVRSPTAARNAATRNSFRRLVMRGLLRRPIRSGQCRDPRADDGTLFCLKCVPEARFHRASALCISASPLGVGWMEDPAAGHQGGFHLAAELVALLDLG